MRLGMPHVSVRGHFYTWGGYYKICYAGLSLGHAFKYTLRRGRCQFWRQFMSSVYVTVLATPSMSRSVTESVLRPRVSCTAPRSCLLESG